MTSPTKTSTKKVGLAVWRGTAGALCAAFSLALASIAGVWWVIAATVVKVPVRGLRGWRRPPVSVGCELEDAWHPEHHRHWYWRWQHTLAWAVAYTPASAVICLAIAVGALSSLRGGPRGVKRRFGEMAEGALRVMRYDKAGTYTLHAYLMGVPIPPPQALALDG